MTPRSELAITALVLVLAGCSPTSDATGSPGARGTGATAPAATVGHVAGRVGELCTSGGGAGGRHPASSHAPEYVQALVGSDPVATSVVDSDGNYYLTLRPGRYTLRQGRVTGEVTVTAGILSLESFFCGRALPVG
jgi:hypothetical protein